MELYNLNTFLIVFMFYIKRVLIKLIASMSKQRPRRINYRINYCSSEDPEGPVSELVLQSSEARGWITKRFAPYPQTIVI